MTTQTAIDRQLTLVEDRDLNTVETERLAILEKTIEVNFLGFMAVGSALAEINERRLYRTRNGRTFDEYCREIWGINVRRAYQLIKATEAVENVKNFSQNETQVIEIAMPKNEAQAIEVASLPPEKQYPFWKAYVTQAQQDGKKITASSIRKAIRDQKGRNLEAALQKQAGKQQNKGTEPGEDDGYRMSPEFEAAWQALWDQVDKELLANWRYTSKEVVYERTKILLEALEESGVRTPSDNGVA